MMRCLVAIAAAIMTTTMVILPADAHAKKAKRPDAQKRYEVQTPSLDGRITGGLVPADTKRFNTTDWACPTAPTAIDAISGLCERRPTHAEPS